MTDHCPIRRCDLCGREGTRRWRVIPPITIDTPQGQVLAAPLVACTGLVRCHRRALRQIPLDERQA